MKLISLLIVARAVGKKAKYLNNISSNTRIHILVNTSTKLNIFPGSEGVKVNRKISQDRNTKYIKTIRII
jgi:hypothetical protein